MMPRIQAEEQQERITAARVAQGAGDDDGKRAIGAYEDNLDRQRTGETAKQERQPVSPKARRLEAAALGLSVGKPPALEEREERDA